MSEYVRINGIRNLRPALERGQRNIRKALDGAIWQTAQKAVRPIKRRVPVAFGELRDSIQAYRQGLNGNPVTSVDAPHAGAVEIGSPPHKPNWERLLAWVRLRGIQGQTKGGVRKRFAKSLGPTTPFQARRVAKMFNALRIGVDIRQSPMTSMAEASLEHIAQAISKGIEEHGTRPHWYVRESLPEIKTILDTEIRKSLARVTDSANPASRLKPGEYELV